MSDIIPMKYRQYQCTNVSGHLTPRYYWYYRIGVPIQYCYQTIIGVSKVSQWTSYDHYIRSVSHRTSVSVVRHQYHSTPPHIGLKSSEKHTITPRDSQRESNPMISTKSENRYERNDYRARSKCITVVQYEHTNVLPYQSCLPLQLEIWQVPSA